MNSVIWVDADSMPQEARRMIIRFSARQKIPAVFVANRAIPFDTKNALITMTVTEPVEGAADNYIVEHAAAFDIAITRDIPLAARLVEKNIIVLNDRGRKYTKENMSEYLSVRNWTADMAQFGLFAERAKTYGAKDLEKFANCLDREITALKILHKNDSGAR